MFQYYTSITIPILDNNTSPVNQQSINFARLLNKRQSSADMCFLNQVIKVLFASAISGADGSRTQHCLHSDARFNRDSLFVPVNSQNIIHKNVSLLDIQPLMSIIGFDENKKKNTKLYECGTQILWHAWRKFKFSCVSIARSVFIVQFISEN